MVDVKFWSWQRERKSIEGNKSRKNWKPNDPPRNWCETKWLAWMMVKIYKLKKRRTHTHTNVKNAKGSNVLKNLERERKSNRNLILLRQDHLNQFEFKWISMHVRSNDECKVLWSIVWRAVLCCGLHIKFNSSWFFRVFSFLQFACCRFLSMKCFHVSFFDEPIKIDLIPMNAHTNTHFAAYYTMHECQIRFMLYFMFIFFSPLVFLSFSYSRTCFFSLLISISEKNIYKIRYTFEL